MIGLHNLKPAIGARHRKKIVGRGEGSGHGGSATRGMKGQKSRSGDGKMVDFAGGQMPLVRAIPKRGFTNRNRVAYTVVNVGQLAQFDGEVSLQTLRDSGLAKRSLPVKVLGTGELKKSLKVAANAFSKSAIEKIKAAGGTAETVK